MPHVPARRPSRLALLVALAGSSVLLPPAATRQPASATAPVTAVGTPTRDGPGRAAAGPGGSDGAAGAARPAAARPPVPAPRLPAGFRDTVALSGLQAPTNVEFAPDGRVFVAEKSGLVKVFDSLADPVPAVFADLRTQVHDFWDRGLLGLALHPRFPADPAVYVLYTHDAPLGGTAPWWGRPGADADTCPTPPGANSGGCVVSGRLAKLVPTGAGAVHEQVLIEDWCQQFPSHSVGDLAFGPDGALYASGGDGASFGYADWGQAATYGPTPANPCGDPPAPAGARLAPPDAEGGALRSQDPRTASDPVGLDGTVIRVDPATGAALPDNPSAGDPDENSARIIAYGLRNPFRMTVRPGTAEIWLGEVGWNAHEEVNRIGVPTSGVANFGWPCYEGAARQEAYDAAGLAVCEHLYTTRRSAQARSPYWSYPQDRPVAPGDTCPVGSGASTSGVAFGSGQSYPDRYAGALFVADHTRGCIWALPRGGTGYPDPARAELFVGAARGPVELETGPGGDLFYVNLDGGEIRRISYAPSNRPPLARAVASPSRGDAPLTVRFDGSASTDPDSGDTLRYAWDLDGDGAFDDSTAPQPSTTYTRPGRVAAALRVTDGDGATDTAAVPVDVSNDAPTPAVTAPAPTTTFRVGERIRFAGTATDPQQGTLPPAALTWELIQHHCTAQACHTHLVQTFRGVAAGEFVAPDHDYPSHLELRLTARDALGLTGKAAVLLRPRTVVLTFATDPAGLTLAVGSGSAAAPLSREVIVGSQNSVAAPSPQVRGGRTYVFVSWSDGGAPAHNVTAPATPTTYTARFREAPGGR